MTIGFHRAYPIASSPQRCGRIYPYMNSEANKYLWQPPRRGCVLVELPITLINEVMRSLLSGTRERDIARPGGLFIMQRTCRPGCGNLSRKVEI